MQAGLGEGGAAGYGAGVNPSDTPSRARRPSRRFRAVAVLAAAGVLAAGAVRAVGAPGDAAPAGSGPPASSRAPPRAAHAMVAAADPRAVDAGVAVLRAGGTAADAAVAVQAVLGLVEPQSSGLGGGAFMVWLDGRTGRLSTWDGRETAPAAAGPDLFTGPDGRELGFAQAVLSGRSTGAPGAVAMLAAAHKAHGRRPWASLFGEGERLATEGFTVGGRLAAAVAGRGPQAQTPDATRYFSRADGTRVRQGDVLRNPDYADTLRRIAAEGPDGLLKGPVARDLVAKTREGLPGALTEADLAAYRPVVREALCRPYRAYRICSAPPPAGGVGVLEILGLLERTDIAARGPKDPQAWVEFAQASRLGYADRDRYVGDPGFAPVPVEGMTAPAYLDARAPLVATLGGARVQPGRPPGAPAPAPDRTVEPGGTTHFVIADAFGDVLSMTTTVESVFGSGRMTHGFFLNNQLTDFSWGGRAGLGPHPANAPGPGKRPRSSMSPVIILDRQGRFVATVGSPGGNSIIAYVVKAIVGWADWGLPMQQAVALPNLVARGDSVSLEAGAAPEVAAALRAAGLTVRGDAGEASGLHAIVRRPGGGFEGAADPRREGVARGY